MPVLPREFYLRDDVVQISRELLGKILWTNINGDAITSGTIVETEAYAGVIDKASHAYAGRFTKRTKIMYEEGGLGYIYLCYGIHHLFNVITNIRGIPHAVLIRAVEPVEGVDVMLSRRNKNGLDYSLTSGPGSLTTALGIKTSHTGIDLTTGNIQIHSGISIPDNRIKAGPRVGIAYAREHALLPWRFSIKENPWVSKQK
jgi:DNA-3-methyladenine glycosylase